MADVIIKCRVTFGKKCSTIALNHILFVRDLYFRHRKSFRLSGRIMGTLPYLLSRRASVFMVEHLPLPTAAPGYRGVPAQSAGLSVHG